MNGILPASLLLCIMFPFITLAQKAFQFNTEVGDSLEISVNGSRYVLYAEPIEVQTNYPLFDTLQIFSEGPNIGDPILCNFKPDSAYSIASACCGSLDIFPACKLMNDSLGIWDYEGDFSRIQKLLMDRLYISIGLAIESREPIYGWYADLACFPVFKKLEVKNWAYGVPQKCFYWNNISSFIFFKSKVEYPENMEGQVEDIYPEEDDIEIIGEIQVRLFDNERFVMTFDPESGQVQLEYE